MKKILFCLILLNITLSATAQKNKPVSDTAAVWQTYRVAVAFNDLIVAKQSLFEIIAMQPENKSVYDSLASIYFVLGAYQQTILAADKAPANEGLKELKAYSYRNLGDLKTALQLFEELYTASDGLANGYQVAGLQFSLKRMGECESTLNKILVHPDAATKKVVIALENGQSQEVSYLAASENLKGVMMNEMGKPDVAKGCFERAIANEPEFVLAKNNLANIKTPPAAK